MDFQSYSLSIFYRISNGVHEREGGGVDISWNSPIPVVWEMLILSRLHLIDLTSPKDTIEVRFIKYFNDKTQ